MSLASFNLIFRTVWSDDENAMDTVHFNSFHVDFDSNIQNCIESTPAQNLFYIKGRQNFIGTVLLVSKMFYK